MINTKVREGIILIPDFSGFTEFVYNTKIYTGEYIVKQLLSALIEANNHHFYISEIEGDAILFYKYKKKPDYHDVMIVLKRMLHEFSERIVELSQSLETTIHLSLKFIVHYGKFSKFQIKKFKKLYGTTIVEAHKLLKNEYANKPSYILFSSTFLERAKGTNDEVSENCVVVPEVGMIYYFET